MTRLLLATAAGLILLIAFCAQAQHTHDLVPAKIVGKVKDPQRGMVMPAPQPGETVAHAMDHALPVGNGAPLAYANGAWVIPPTTGVYTFPQTSQVAGKRIPVFMAQQTNGPVSLVAGRQYRLWPWKGPLVWITPAGKQEKVAPEYLLGIDSSTMIRPIPK